MTVLLLTSRVLTALRGFREDIRASLSIEMLIALPLLIWGYLGIMIFTDAFRARMESQAAALHIADLISRNTETITEAYLEGLNDVYDFLTTRNSDTRLRISSVMWDSETEEPAIVWSYGTRGLPSLVDLSGVSTPPDPDGEDQTGFMLPVNQLPVSDLANRIPTVLPGEAVILVEAFAMWETPMTNFAGLRLLEGRRLDPLAVTRPRFSPFIRYEHDNDIFPDGEVEFPPIVGEPSGPGEEELPEPEPEPEEIVTIINTDFNSGAPPGWSHNTVTQSLAQSFLGPFGQETMSNPVTYHVDLGDQSGFARIEFDLLLFDTWDGYNFNWARPEGEHMIIMVNGTSISTEAFDVSVWPTNYYGQTRRTVASRHEGRFTTTMELTQYGTNFFGAAAHDQRWRVTIDVENPTQAFTLGFAANLDEPIDNESFGLTNFKITAERGSHGPPHFVPSQPFVGTDPYNRFAIHTGCPDPQLAAQTQQLRVQDLTADFQHRVRVRGDIRLRDCPGFSSSYHGRIFASPSLVVDFDRENMTSGSNRLRIQTDDGNNGRTCDSNLLVRDPFGQWSFHRDIQRPTLLDPLGLFANYNARLNMGYNASGEYHIWVMNATSVACNADIIFSLY